MKPSPAGSVSAIIPAFNESGGSLSRTLRGLLGQTVRPERFVVVDDGSPVPVSIDADLAPEVELITLPVNGGTSAAKNRGAQLTATEHLLFVDCDVMLRPQWLERALGFMQLNAEVGAVSGVIVPMVGSTLLRAWRLQHVETKVHRSGSTDPEPQQWLVGHALLVRRAVFDEIGGFDARFRCAGDDVDISRRIRSSGASLYHHPDLVAESFEEPSIDLLARKSLRDMGWDIRPRLTGWAPCAAVRPVTPLATTASIATTLIDRSARDMVRRRFKFVPVDMAVAFRSCVLALRALRR